MGLSYTGSRCLLVTRVSGNRRDPIPPASTTPLILPPETRIPQSTLFLPCSGAVGFGRRSFHPSKWAEDAQRKVPRCARDFDRSGSRGRRLKFEFHRPPRLTGFLGLAVLSPASRIAVP